MSGKKLITEVLHPFGLEIRRAEKEERFLLPLNRGTVSRLLYFKRLLDDVKNIEGDIVECGAGKMKSFQMIGLLAELEQPKRMCWGFDSFEGYPETSPEDVSPRNLRKGDWKAITRDQADRILELTRMDKEFLKHNVHIVKGFFEDVLPEIQIEKIAFLHLDVNLYKSYKFCLETLFPKVANGGVVLFDEYMNADEAIKCPGAKKAIDEYFGKTSQKILRDEAYGKYYLVKQESSRER